MTEPVFESTKTKLKYQVLQPGGFTTWYKDSERYHRSAGDWKWMEEDVVATEGVEAKTSWKTFINECADLNAIQKRKELYEEEKVCGVIRMHTSCAYQEQTKEIVNVKELYAKLKELASGICHEAVEQLMKRMWSSPWTVLQDSEAQIMKFNNFFRQLEDNSSKLPDGVYATALLSSWPASELASKKMLLAQKGNALCLQDVQDEMRRIGNRTIATSGSGYQAADEVNWTNTESIVGNKRPRDWFSLGNKLYLDCIKELKDVPKTIKEKWDFHFGSYHSTEEGSPQCRSDCWMNLTGEYPKIIKAYVDSRRNSINIAQGPSIPRKKFGVFSV